MEFWQVIFLHLKLIPFHSKFKLRYYFFYVLKVVPALQQVQQGLHCQSANLKKKCNKEYAACPPFYSFMTQGHFLRVKVKKDMPVRSKA